MENSPSNLSKSKSTPSSSLRKGRDVRPQSNPSTPRGSSLNTSRNNRVHEQSPPTTPFVTILQTPSPRSSSSRSTPGISGASSPVKCPSIKKREVGEGSKQKRGDEKTATNSEKKNQRTLKTSGSSSSVDSPTPLRKVKSVNSIPKKKKKTSYETLSKMMVPSHLESRSRRRTMTMTPVPSKPEVKLTRATSGGSLPSVPSGTLLPTGGSLPSTTLALPRATSDVPSSLRSAPYLSAVYYARRQRKKPLSPRGTREEDREDKKNDKKEEGEERRESKKDEEKKEKKKRGSKYTAAEKKEDIKDKREREKEDIKDKAKKEKKVDKSPLLEREKDQLVVLDSESS